MRMRVVLLFFIGVGCSGEFGDHAEAPTGKSNVDDTSSANAPGVDTPALQSMLPAPAVTGATGPTATTEPSVPLVPAPCPTGALLCEQFEDGLSTTRWLVTGDFIIDATTPTPDGDKSLHMAYAHAGEQMIELKTPPAAPDDRMFLRLYMRFGNLALPGAHPSFVDVRDDDNEIGFGSISNDFSMMGWGFYSGGLDNARAWYEGGSWHPGNEDGDDAPSSEQTYAAGQWICVELMYQGDPQQVTIWLDGTERPEMNLSTALWHDELGHDPPANWTPSFDGARWRFGLTSFGPETAPLDIWFDAIVFAHSRIGCN